MRRRWDVGALALALAIALGAPGSAAWATGPGAGTGTGADSLGGSVTNKDVPTDDTGVVASRDEASSGTGGSKGSDNAVENNADAQPGIAPAAGEGAEDDPDAPINEDVPTDETGVVETGDAAEGDSAGGGEDGKTSAKPVRPTLPDPVFGEGINEDNLVNPQQKPDSSFIYDTSIAALQGADSYLNNQTVQVTGEVIGDRIRAEFDPGFCWIVLQGSDKDHSEVPVFMTMDDTDLIDTYGAYGRKGTTLQVRGIFHLICPEHEGLTDLHADAVTFVEKGSITDQPFDIGAFVPGLVLVAIGFIMLIVFHQMREGQR